jgi:ribonuclease P protein component
VIGRLAQTADFQRLLAAPIRSRSAHFAVHHVASGPAPTGRLAVHGSSTDLSTDSADLIERAVDKMPTGHWLGSVVPKRHARRAVTRNLLRRQIRQAMNEHQAALPAGLWLVRLRAPFDRQRFVSAASVDLRQVARAELQALFSRAR